MSAKKAIKQIVSFSKKAKAPFPTKEAFVFLSFLILSTLLWFLQKMSHIQELKADVPIEYVGIPNNVEIIGNLPKTLTVRFKDKGSSLFSYVLRRDLPPFTVNLTDRFTGSGRIILPTVMYENSIFSTLKSSASQIHISPDTLIIKYERLYKKKIPVRFYGSIQPAQQYAMTRGVSIDPSWIEVYGPKKIIDTLSVIYTRPIILEDVKDSVYGWYKLNIFKGLHASQTKVHVHATVEAFTEKTLEVPVVGINVPEEFLLRTFPATVKVVCLVSVSHFKELGNDDIQVVIDYNTLMKGNNGKVKPKVYCSSAPLIHYHTSPETVDFLLETKK
jgi:hypothetical protein